MKKGCYIIYSEKLNRYYIGACQNGVASRIEKHNTGFYGKSSYTATASDWKLVLFLEAVDYKHALRMERKIKQMKSAKYIRNLLSYSEMRARLVEETKST